eukprot:s349_g32.t1
MECPVRKQRCWMPVASTHAVNWQSAAARVGHHNGKVTHRVQSAYTGPLEVRQIGQLQFPQFGTHPCPHEGHLDATNGTR